MTLEETANGILLRPAISVPIELYTEESIAEFSKDEKALGKKLARS